MKKHRQLVVVVVGGIALLAVAFIEAGAAQAEYLKSPYQRMAPLEQYLMPDRHAEIRLAHSAAPAAISDHATVLVLARHGYEVAMKGTTVSRASWNDHGCRPSIA